MKKTVFLHDAILLAKFECIQALRSKRFWILIGLYFLSALIAANVFISAIDAAEVQLASQLNVAKTKTTGVMLNELLQSKSFQRVLGFLIGDDGIVEEILHIPVMVILFGWLSYVFLPFFIAFISADCFSKEIESGSARYALFRVSQASWICGKTLGQSAMILLGIIVAGCAMLLVGSFSLHRFDLISNMYWLTIIGLRVWVYTFYYLGFTLFLSLCFRSSLVSRGMAIAMLLSLIVLSILVQYPLQKQAPVVAQTLFQLFPDAHELQLWSSDPALYLSAMLMLICLAVVWLVMGAWVLKWRGT